MFTSKKLPVPVDRSIKYNHLYILGRAKLKHVSITLWDPNTSCKYTKRICCHANAPFFLGFPVVLKKMIGKFNIRVGGFKITCKIYE